MADSQVSGLVEQVKISNTTHNLASTAYGICDTAAGTAAKTVNMTGFYLTKGVTVHIKFTNANSAASPTLNINNTGAKALSISTWAADSIISLTYDNSKWVSNTKKIDSSDNAIVRFDGTTGEVQNSSALIDDNGFIKSPGLYVHKTTSVNQSGYIKFLTLTVTGTYVDRGIKIDYSTRAGRVGSIYGNFANVNSTDPNLTLYKTGDANIYYIKSNTSTWDLYINKSENYADCVFSITNPGEFINNKITLAWISEHVTALPENCLTAEVYNKKVNITGNVYIDDKENSNGIYYKGTKATTQMINFIDNTTDVNGNGIKIGGGGVTVISAGESKSINVNANAEDLYLLADNVIYLESNAQTLANRLGFKVSLDGHIIPTKAETNNDNQQNLGASDAQWANVYTTAISAADDMTISTTAASKTITINSKSTLQLITGAAASILFKINSTEVARFNTDGNLAVNNSIIMTKAGECGLEVDNTQSTNPNKVAFVVGSSGKGGIYSRKHSKWIVYADASGNVALNGNAATATRIDGNVTTCSDANNHNIWISSNSSGSGIPNIVSGVYITPSTKTITATTFAGSLSGNASTATKLAHTTLDSTTINNTAGSFAFSGSGAPWAGTDWVGLQIGDSADKFQISASGNSLVFRQNDSGGTNTSWLDWVTMLTSANYSSYRDYSSYLFVRHSSWVKGTQIASDASLTINFVEKGTGTADTNKLGMIKSYACGGTKNTRIGLWAYQNEPSSTGADYFLLEYGWDGTTAVKRTRTDAKVYGAVWNDYAEFRKTNENAKPGQVVVDNDDGSLNITYARLLPGAQVVSDTFGFAIGETEETKTPLAVSGRVLVYTYQDRNKYHAGQAVCSAPNGTVDIMTRREIETYPDAIIGIVSEIPDYEEWGQDNVKVNGRIWIKVR